MIGGFARHVWQQYVGYIALFVALGGVSYAAVTITGADVEDGSLTGQDIENASISTADLRSNAVRGPDIQPGAINSDDIADGSILAKDLHPSLGGGATGPAGPAGPPGETGPKGDTGATGPAGANSGFVLSGRMSDVLANENSQYGTVSGHHPVSVDETAVETLTPPVALRATDISFRATGTVEDGMNLYLRVNGALTNMFCNMRASGVCSDTTDVAIPPSSRLSVYIANCCDPSPGSLLVGLMLEEVS